MASDDGEPQDEQQHEQAAKKPPGTWTPMETLHLIDAYQQKWYALKRGQLRTSHWEEVAESLAARCAGQPDATGKSSVQCRHKVEKLRRKYRAERQLFLRKGPGSSRWPFFERMDNMERGPAAAAEAAAGAIKAALPFADLELQKRFGVGRELQDHESAMSFDEDAEDSDQPPPKVFSNRKRRQHHHNHHQDALPDNDGSYSSLNRKHGLFEAPSAFNKRDDYRSPRVSEKPGSTGLRRQAETAPFAELVSVIRSLGEGFLRMEQMKIQMQRETERFRADMELRRTEMILDSQKQIADLFTKALISSKKSKKPQSPKD